MASITDTPKPVGARDAHAPAPVLDVTRPFVPLARRQTPCRTVPAPTYAPRGIDDPLSPARANACIGCGMTLPANETECAFCIRARATGSEPIAVLLLHWLVFLVSMTVIIGGGYLLSQ